MSIPAIIIRKIKTITHNKFIRNIKSCIISLNILETGSALLRFIKKRTGLYRIGLKLILNLAHNKFQGLPGIKQKTEENIVKGIEILRKGQERIPLGMALPLSHEIVHRLKASAPIERITVAGSVRRQRETIRDIDLLVLSPESERVMEAFVGLPPVGETLAEGRTKSSVRTHEGVQVDLRVLESRCFGAALCYFTGSKAHNIRIRDLAVRRGLKINEYGVFREDRWIAGREEVEVYQTVDLPWIPPELREDRGEIEAAQRKVTEITEQLEAAGIPVRAPVDLS